MLSAKDRDNNSPLFEPVLETTSWSFNEQFRRIRVPVRSLRAADVEFRVWLWDSAWGYLGVYSGVDTLPALV